MYHRFCDCLKNTFETRLVLFLLLFFYNCFILKKRMNLKDPISSHKRFPNGPHSTLITKLQGRTQ